MTWLSNPQRIERTGAKRSVLSILWGLVARLGGGNFKLETLP